jgi:hypothetical protein
MKIIAYFCPDQAVKFKKSYEIVIIYKISTGTNIPHHGYSI